MYIDQSPELNVDFLLELIDLFLVCSLVSHVTQPACYRTMVPPVSMKQSKANWATWGLNP